MKLWNYNGIGKKAEQNSYDILAAGFSIKGKLDVIKVLLKKNYKENSIRKAGFY